MSERKRFSKRRADALWMLVDDAITQFRIAVLKGALSSLSRDGMEEVCYKQLADLPDRVADKYRERLTP